MSKRALGKSPAGQPLVWMVACLVPLVSASFLVANKLESSNDCSLPLPTYHWSSPTKYHYLKHDITPSILIPSASTILACSALNGEYHRLKQTPADSYYAQHHHLPRPANMHATLPVNQGQQDENSKNILVVGDVHGCMVELQSLLEKAVREYNDGLPFSFIIFVGDLCNKGPQSAEVIRWARCTPNVFTVRGNHDDGALEAALGDGTRRNKGKYQWVMQGESVQHGGTPSDGIVLSDNDVAWLAELPYTLTIPGWYLGQPQDTLIVHAGLIPNQPLEQQSISTMITIREVLPICDQNSRKDGMTHFEYHERQKRKPTNEGPEVICGVPMPWAKAWNGPQRAIFGHDARRGFQRYKGSHAIGLDTGAVYGKELTGLILPGETVVAVPSKPYSRVDKSNPQ